MSHFPFAPSPNFGRSEHPFVTAGETFSPEEVDRIVALGGSLVAAPASVGDGVVNGAIRESETAWIRYTQESAWLYDKLAFIARQVNGQFYGFDLYGFSEDFQFTVYRDEGSHYTWHQDHGTGAAPRKLSMVVQLSNPDEYEGGELQIFSKNEPTDVFKAKGNVVAFPSYMLHRVTPVTKGVRRSLVVWITGPSFK